MRKLKKTFTGMYKEIDNNEVSDIFLVELDEYEKLKFDVEHYKQKTNELEYTLNNPDQSIIANLQNKIYQYQNELNKLTNQLNEYDAECIGLRATLENERNTVDSLMQQVKKYQSTNSSMKNTIQQLSDENKQYCNSMLNMQRIMKERANAKRNLVPKKQHHGYVILSQEEAEYSIRKKSNVYPIKFWKMRVQTPIDCLMPLDKEKIKKELSQVFDLDIVLKFWLEECSYSLVEEVWEKTQAEHRQFIFKIKYKSNHVSGLWEVECWIPFYYNNMLNS